MAKNQKHKAAVKNEDRIEINVESCKAYEEELERQKCDSRPRQDEASNVKSEKSNIDKMEITQANDTEGVKTSSEDCSSSDASSIAELSEEVEKWKNEYLRKAADFENYRKRMIKEKKDAIDYANESILQNLVAVLDDFDRGIDAVEKYATEAVKPYMQGFAMIRGQLYSMLESKYSLKCYKSEGEVFDPNIHDVKASRESDEVEVETVEKELLKGYKLHDRVIRVAQVETVKPKK